MNSLRPELLELTPAGTALSNAGLLKAQSLKELENGNVPEISHENGALIATFSDGVHAAGDSPALKEAQCSCGASGMCRHRVMLVLSYQRLCATVSPRKKKKSEIRQSGWKNWLPCPMPPANAHRHWSLKASPLSCSVRRAKFPLPAYR